MARHKVEHASASKFDKRLTEPEVGIRALWLLYKRGQWGALEDFGLVRREAEPALRAFERYETVMTRPTRRQCRKLVELVPGLAEAGKELRLAYVLKQYDKHKGVGNGRQTLPRRSENDAVV